MDVEDQTTEAMRRGTKGVQGGVRIVFDSTCANHDEKYNKFQSVAWEIHVDLMRQVRVQEKCATVYIMEKTTLNFDFSELSNL